ncbi:MAG: hypothetical protein K2P79_02390 [Sphingomonas sp.]|nr:hypothetical protein [Sphingomonas sp.]
MLLRETSYIQRGLLSIFARVGKAPPPGSQHPPEHYGSLMLVPLIAVFLRLSPMQPRRRGALPS